MTGLGRLNLSACRLKLVLSAGAANCLDGNGRKSRLFRDRPILFGDDCTSRGVALTQCCRGDAAVGSLRAVFVDNIEEHEFYSCSRLPSPFGYPFLVATSPR